MSYENLPWNPVPQVLDVFYKYNTKPQLQIENFLRLHCIFFLFDNSFYFVCVTWIKQHGNEYLVLWERWTIVIVPKTNRCLGRNISITEWSLVK